MPTSSDKLPLVEPRKVLVIVTTDLHDQNKQLYTGKLVSDDSGQ
jgi:hypothetical protein